MKTISMRKFLILAMPITASFLIACSPAANNTNDSNKPANAANNAAPAVNTAAIEADVKKLVIDMAASMSKNDVAAFEKGTGDNYMFIGPDGRVATKAERVASFKSGDMKYDSVAYDEVSVRPNPQGTGAIVIARATVKGTNMGQKIDGQFRATQVWRKTDDGWKLVHGHVTPITGVATSPAANTAAKSNSATSPPAANTANTANANKY